MPPLPKPNWFEPRVTLGNILSIIVMLGTVVTIYTNLKLDVARASQDISTVQDQVRQLDNDNLPTRMTVLENTIVQNKASRDKQNDEMLARLDRMQDTIGDLSVAVGSLNATLRAQGTLRP